MMGRYLLMVAALVTLCRSQSHGDTPSSISQLARCVATDQQLAQAVNQSMGGSLQQVVINCLAYQDPQRTVELAVVSGYADGNSVRYTVQCSGGLLVITESALNATNETVACHECIADSSVQLCNDSNLCSDMCTRCYGPSEDQCLACEVARSNGKCVTQCPNMQSPNSSRGNECECTHRYRVLPDCECERECVDLPLNRATCECEDCPSGQYPLVINVTGPVPNSVRGYPPTSEHHVTEEECREEGHERRRRTEQHGEEGEGGETTENEPSVCVTTQQCRDALQFGGVSSGQEQCYSCGIKYCLDCTRNNSCTRCREGTLLTGTPLKTCKGFYEVIAERLVELECEELAEENAREDELLHLKIILPIVCIGTLIVFLGLAVIAHFRYPHVGENKRHRKPNKKTDVPEHERPWRPQATVRLR